MAEYLFFLDLLLLADPSARILEKAVCEAWIYESRAHEQDRRKTNAKFTRTVWFRRMYRVQNNSDCRDKVMMPDKYLREPGSMPSETRYDWDTEGDLDLAELLERAMAHCANSHESNTKLSACGACRITMYCSRDCQKKHWKARPRILCKTWADAWPSITQ
jgi:hypothetical protein